MVLLVQSRSGSGVGECSVVALPCRHSVETWFAPCTAVQFAASPSISQQRCLLGRNEEHKHYDNDKAMLTQARSAFRSEIDHANQAGDGAKLSVPGLTTSMTIPWPATRASIPHVFDPSLATVTMCLQPLLKSYHSLCTYRESPKPQSTSITSTTE